MSETLVRTESIALSNDLSLRRRRKSSGTVPIVLVPRFDESVMQYAEAIREELAAHLQETRLLPSREECGDSDIYGN